MLLDDDKDPAFEDIPNEEFELRKSMFLILTLKINMVIDDDWIVYARLQDEEEFGPQPDISMQELHQRKHDNMRRAAQKFEWTQFMARRRPWQKPIENCLKKIKHLNTCDLANCPHTGVIALPIKDHEVSNSTSHSTN